MMDPSVLAHQGGWDEILLFGIPIVLALLAVRWAERRAKRKAEGDGEADEADREP